MLVESECLAGMQNSDTGGKHLRVFNEGRLPTKYAHNKQKQLAELSEQLYSIRLMLVKTRILCKYFHLRLPEW